MKSNDKKTNGFRKLLIRELTRQQLIDFVKRKDSFYQFTDFTGHSDKQIRQLAISVDRKVEADKKSTKMKTDNQIRQQLINYIKANDKSYSTTKLDNHSLTALVMIKTAIEIKTANGWAVATN